MEILSELLIPSEARTWAEIDLGAIRHNLGVVREKAGPLAGVIAVVKDNAYGHGLREVAGAIVDGVALWGVANVEEARELGETGRNVLLLSPCLPGDRAEVVSRGWIATVSSAKEAAEFAGGRVSFKVDTGMGRIGCWQDEALD